MPTYEYECLTCKYEFEKLQSITAEPIKECPKCGNGVRKKIGAGSGIIFKGSGFYTTDYRNEDFKSKSKTEVKAPCTTCNNEPKCAANN